VCGNPGIGDREIGGQEINDTEIGKWGDRGKMGIEENHCISESPFHRVSLPHLQLVEAGVA
jgi:hypothetical protein